MATKSGYKLDVEAFCQLAVQAKGFRNNVEERVSAIKASIAKLHEGDGIDGLSGAQGEAISKALDQIAEMCDSIADHANKIHIVADKKSNAMKEAYKNHGGDEVLDATTAQNQRVSKK